MNLGSLSPIPYARAWKIALRTIHLVATYMLVSGHANSVALHQLRPILVVAIVTGITMAGLEAYPRAQSLLEGWSFLVVLKVALLGFVPYTTRYRLGLIVAAIIIAGIGSHLPARFRHYSLLYGKVVEH